jgi:hypothetical protein
MQLRFWGLTFYLFLNSFCAKSQFVWCSEQSEEKTILILGDSHLMGTFGEHLHAKLHQFGGLNIMSIAIGGAGSLHFTKTMKNMCCGYKIRSTCSNTPIGTKSKIPTLEFSNLKTDEIVAKFASGNLEQLVKITQPDVVIIALGSNFSNAHKDLVQKIINEKSDVAIMWIGPFLRKSFEPRMSAINKTIKEYNQICLFRSDDFIGHDTIGSYHFYGRKAKIWAETIIERMNPYLSFYLERDLNYE